MRNCSRNKIFLLLFGLFFGAFAFFALRVLRPYDVTVPLPVGPMTKMLLIGLGALAAAALYFAFFPLSVERLIGWVLIGVSLLWFCLMDYYAFHQIESQPAYGLARWMILGIACMIAGVFCLFSVNPFELSEKAQLLLMLAAVTIVMSVMLRSGYGWDDAAFATQIPAMRVTGDSIWKKVWGEITEYCAMGRLNPFATFHFLLFYYIPNAFCYKLLLLLLTVADCALFYSFMRKWTGSHSLALCVSVLLTVCFQLRLYNDPLSGYYGLMQIMFAELILSLSAFLDYLKGSRKGFWLSLIFFLMDLLSYEMAYPFLAFFVLFAVSHERNLWKGLRKSLPWIGMTMVFFAVSMWLRATNITAATAYSGTTFNADPGAILRAWGCQILGAFPMSFQLSDYDPGMFGELISRITFFPHNLSVFLRSLRWQDAGVFFVVLLLFLCNRGNRRRLTLTEWLFGVLLVILPGMTIAISEKYQRDLTPGIAYIPVYISYFGAAILLYGFAALSANQTIWKCFAGLLCAAILLNQQNNRTVNETLNETYLYPRQTGEAALQAGILRADESMKRAVVSLNGYSLWEHFWDMQPLQSEFYSLNSRMPVNAYSAADYISKFPDSDFLSGQNISLISYGGDKEHGFAKSGRMRSAAITPERDSLWGIAVTETYVFVRGYDENSQILYRPYGEELLLLPLSTLYVVNKTPQGTLFKFYENPVIEFDSISVVF